MDSTEPDLEAQRDEDLAFFVVALGMAPPDYWQLTLNQRNAIVTAYNRAQRK